MTKMVLALACGTALLLAQKQPQPKSQKELEALQALFQAPDPDSRIKAADTLISKFADTDFKAFALQVAADSFRAKGDNEKAIIYAERAAEAEPGSIQAVQAKLLIAEITVQGTRENDLDREEKLTRVEKLAKEVQETLKTVAKPNPQLPDEQWEGVKKDLNSSTFEMVGMAAQVRKKHDVAITNFKLAVDAAASQGRPMARLAAGLEQAGKPDEALAIVDKLSADPNLDPGLKPFLDQVKARATKAKAAGAK
ncbi:MAG TPA: hypothetical protein DEH78_05815 [Solibacterales bacterium]|nr:hypothetical protein [Bryobacterales bacterium]